MSALFILQLFRGKEYTALAGSIDSGEFPLASLYVVGFAWNATGILKIRDKRYKELSSQAALLYDPNYTEYYVNVVWAQTVTFGHLFLTFTFLLAGLIYSMALLLVAAGLFFTVLIVMYCLQNMKNKVSARTEECEDQLSEVVSTMAVLVNSGMILKDAWIQVAESGTGAIYDLMRQASDRMKNGLPTSDAIYLFGKLSNSTDIKKFTSLLLQSMEKGGSEITIFLANQSSEMWQLKRQRMLRKGEQASTKLLVPIVLIFLGVIIVVLSAAFAGALF